MRKKFWLGAGLYALVFLLSRGWGVLDFPLFVDEGRHILRAQATLEGDLFIGLRESLKQTYIWLVAAALPLFGDDILAARLVSLLAGLGAGATCYALARTLYPERGLGWLAAVFYLVSPFALFFDRLALTDSLLALLMGLSLLLSVRLWQRPTFGQAALLGLIFGLAALTKTYAALYYPLPVLAWWWLGREVPWRRAVVLLGTAFAGAALFWLPLGWLGLSIYQADHAEKLAGSGVDIGQNLVWAGAWLGTYVTWPLLGLALLGAGMILYRRERVGWLLLASIVGPVGVFVVGFEVWFSRYLLPVLVPLTVVMARGVAGLGRWRVLQGVLLLVLCLPALWFDALIITNPAQAPLPEKDRHDYIEGRFAGYGLPESAGVIREIAGRAERVVLLRGTDLRDTIFSVDVMGLSLYLADVDNVSLLTVPELDAAAVQQLDTLAQEAAVLTVHTRDLASDEPFVLETVIQLPQVARIASFDKPGGRVRVDVYQWRGD